MDNNPGSPEAELGNTHHRPVSTTPSAIVVKESKQ